MLQEGSCSFQGSLLSVVAPGKGHRFGPNPVPSANHSPGTAGGSWGWETQASFVAAAGADLGDTLSHPSGLHCFGQDAHVSPMDAEPTRTHFP